MTDAFDSVIGSGPSLQHRVTQLEKETAGLLVALAEKNEELARIKDLFDASERVRTTIESENRRLKNEVIQVKNEIFRLRNDNSDADLGANAENPSGPSSPSKNTFTPNSLTPKDKKRLRRIFGAPE